MKKRKYQKPWGDCESASGKCDYDFDGKCIWCGDKKMKTPNKEGMWWVRQTPKSKPRIALIRRYAYKAYEMLTPLYRIQFFDHKEGGRVRDIESHFVSDYPKMVFVKHIPMPK